METITDIPSTIHPDPRPAFAAAARSLHSVVAAIEPDQFRNPTPCTHMDVRQLIDHAGMAVARAAAAGRSVPLEQWPGEEFTMGDDVTAKMATLADDVASAWADERLVEPVQLPWTTMSGADALAIYVNELLVHTWDLATATGQTAEFDDEAIEVASAVIRREVPDAERGPMWAEFKEQMPEGIPFEPPFADATPVADDASPIEHLVAWNGRTV